MSQKEREREREIFRDEVFYKSKMWGGRPPGGIIRGRSPLIKLKPTRRAAERGPSACVLWLASV